MAKTLEVVATGIGFYDSYRIPGDKFFVNPTDKPASWFTPVDSGKKHDSDTGLEGLGAPALKELCDAQNIKYPGNASRTKLIQLIKNPPHPDDEELA